MLGNSPCYQCPAMVIGCHSTCPDYIKYSNEIKEKNKKKEIDTFSFRHKAITRECKLARFK